MHLNSNCFFGVFMSFCDICIPMVKFLRNEFIDEMYGEFFDDFFLMNVLPNFLTYNL